MNDIANKRSGKFNARGKNSGKAKGNVSSEVTEVKEKFSDKIEVSGKVVEVLKGSEYLIELENKHTVKAHVSGKMRMNMIRILPGDTVTVELTPYDLTRGIITWNKR